MATERPILMSTDMVIATPQRRKTKTRRTKGLERIEGVNAIKTMTFPATGKTHTYVDASFTTFDVKINSGLIECPYGAIGDLLWVRESFVRYTISPSEGGFLYKASAPDPGDILRWKPSIHMPKIAARIWLEITDIKVERLQDITEEDAIAEGIKCIAQDKEWGYKDYTGRTGVLLPPFWSFNSLWRTINGADSWEANPWVWVISFKVLSTIGRPACLDQKEVAHG
jgi:hypothetical protein